MASFDYRMPNLLEIALLIGFIITVLFGLVLFINIQRLPFGIVEITSTVANIITAIYVYLATIWIGIIAIILEYTRRDIKEIVENMKQKK